MKDMKDLTKKFKEKKFDLSSTADFMSYHGDDHYQYYANNPCHNNINHVGIGGGEPLNIISGIQKNYRKFDAKLARPWLDYLINRSIWKDIYLNNDVDQVLKDSCVVIHTNTPACLLMQALVATRHSWEYIPMMKAFSALVEGGCPEDMAILLAYLVSCNGDDASLKVGPGSHKSLSPTYMTKPMIKSWLDHEVYDDTLAIYKGWGDYSDFSYKWSRSKDDDGKKYLNPYLQGRIDELNTVKVKVNTNPFILALKNDSDIKSYPFKHLIKNLVIIGNELVDELKAK